MPVGEVALALGCMLGKVFGILEVWIFCRLANCSFEAHRKSLLWPWPSVKEVIWNFGGVAAFAGWQTGALKASRKSLLWIWGACWGRWLEGLAGFGGFGVFGEF